MPLDAVDQIIDHAIMDALPEAAILDIADYAGRCLAEIPPRRPRASTIHAGLKKHRDRDAGCGRVVDKSPKTLNLYGGYQLTRTPS